MAEAASLLKGVANADRKYPLFQGKLPGLRFRPEVGVDYSIAFAEAVNEAYATDKTGCIAKTDKVLAERVMHGHGDHLVFSTKYVFSISDGGLWNGGDRRRRRGALVHILGKRHKECKQPGCVHRQGCEYCVDDDRPGARGHFIECRHTHELDFRKDNACGNCMSRNESKSCSCRESHGDSKLRGKNKKHKRNETSNAANFPAPQQLRLAPLPPMPQVGSTGNTQPQLVQPKPHETNNQASAAAPHHLPPPPIALTPRVGPAANVNPSKFFQSASYQPQTSSFRQSSDERGYQEFMKFYDIHQQLQKLYLMLFQRRMRNERFPARWLTPLGLLDDLGYESDADKATLIRFAGEILRVVPGDAERSQSQPQ